VPTPIQNTVAQMTDDEYYSLYPHASGLPTMRFFNRDALAHTATADAGTLVVIPPPQLFPEPVRLSRDELDAAVVDIRARYK